MPPLTMSLRWMTPSSLPSLATASGVPPDLATLSAITSISRATSGAVVAALTSAMTASTAPLRIEAPSTSMPLMRVWAENGMNLACSGAISRPRMPYFSLASTTIERPSGVSSDSEASWAASASSRSSTPAHRQELRRLAVAERDGAGLVEQQRVDVARRLDGAARHGQHVEAHQPVHAGDADRRQQRADRRRDQGHEQRHQHQHAHGAAGIGGEARDRRDREDEDDRHAGEQDVERDLVRRLLPLGALDQGDHAVEEGRALLRR